MADNVSANLSPLVSRNSAQETLADALRQFIGRGKRYSVKEASNGSGLPERVIECAMIRDHEDTDCREPKLGVILSLASFLGPDFTSSLIKVADQGAHWLPEGDGDLAALNHDCAEFNFEHSKAIAKDGPGGAEIIPIERKALRQIATRMGPRVRTVAA